MKLSLLLIFSNASGHNLLPVPSEMHWGMGRLALKNTLRLQMETGADSGVARAARRTIARLGGAMKTTGTAVVQIRYGRIGQPEKFDEERYSLRVTSAGVLIDAPTSLGVLRALATLEQLPITEKKGRYLPEVDINDRPRFRWRGLLIDAARHFMPVAVIKRNIDGMAAVKLNVLHWHLTDDQGFRVESRTFPRLNGASTDGQFYTQGQVREVLAYATARGIRVVPEIDVPSHTTSWIVAYPRLASNDSVYAPYRLWRTTNVAIDPTREGTFAFLDSLLAEMTGLFPDPYFHAGGDENDGRQWRRTPRIAAFMQSHKMVKADGKTPDKHQLQLYFSGRVAGILRKYGKTMVGWDETLGPNLPPEVVVQSWRGKKGLNEAAQLGHPVLLSAGYYLDLNLSAASSYTTDPLPADTPLNAAQQARVLGGEAAMWSEFADSVILESRIWPRAAAVAERLWSAPAATQDVTDMYRRLGVVSEQLETLGLRHRSAPEGLLLQLAGSPALVAPLRILAEVLEPVKEYKRHFQGYTYTTETTLNRLVDAVPAEAEVARRFGGLADSVGAGLAAGARPEGLNRQLLRLRMQLLRWQTNDARLQLGFTTNPGLREYGPLSANLSAVATVLLARLTQLETGQKATPEWLAAARASLDAAGKPAGQAELAVVKAARRLVR